ncbi:calmodulin-regulated spectrin-associated protein 3 isoform X2 [Stigmatopora argus]
MVDFIRKTFVVPEIKPLDLYDCTKAKICSSVAWLLAKSYGSAENVPAELREPFYRDQYEQEHLKPPVTRLLQSSELYCRAYGLLLLGAGREQAQPKDNAALLRLLADRGLLSKEPDSAPTDADLRRQPVKMSAHLAVMDALMAVGASETVTSAKTKELLGGASSWEDALLHWVNALNQKLRELSERSQSDQTPQAVPENEAQALQPALRYRKDKVQSKQDPFFPAVKEVPDLSTGCAIAAVVHYYCPGLLRLEDVCMKESMSPADSSYNLQFIREFCDGCLKSCCHLALEDMLYSPPELRVNTLSFLAELLHCFEVQRPDFVQPVETFDGSVLSVPKGVNGNSTSPSIFKKPFLPISSPASGSLNQSTSMSHLEGVAKTWSKKSRPLSAISFSIPFGLDSDVDVVMGDPIITRSVSSDQLHRAGSNLASNGVHRASWSAPSASAALPTGAENGVGEAEAGELPTIEEALQIIHNERKLEPRLHPDGAPDGFYLHSPDRPADPVSRSAPTPSGMGRRAAEEPARTRNASECSRDDDSVLRDGSVDSDASEDAPRARSSASDSGVKMTSFAERKKKQGGDPRRAGGDASVPRAASWDVKFEESPGKSPGLNNEMSELGVRLEEKRRAIEAQKKRIEGIFAKHRQRLGKSAFLQLKKEEREDGEDGDDGEAQGGHSGTSSTQEDLSRLTGAGDRERPPSAKSGPAKEQAGEKATAPLGDYNNAVSKLTAALSSLQTDMQRLTEQQNQLVQKKASWVILPSPKTSTPARSPRDSGKDFSSASPARIPRDSGKDFYPASLSPSRKPANHATPPKSPKAVHRRTQSAPPKSPKHGRPPALSRVINTPQSVDRIPHLRRGNPSQYQIQTSSSFSIGDSDSFDELRSLAATPVSPATLTQTRRPSVDDALSEAGSADYESIFGPDADPRLSRANRKEAAAATGGSSSGAPSECSFESDAPPTLVNGKRSSLVEISLSSLPGEAEDDEVAADPFSDAGSDRNEPETKGGLGFFFKDVNERPEDEMAQKRAALLEKQQKRAEEMKRRKLEQEKESKPQWMNIEGWGAKNEEGPRTPGTPPAEGTPQRRGDFTRQEYERRHQLKIMEDLDKVLRQKPTTVRGVKKQRPKSVFRDDSALGHSPVKGLVGNRLNKIYSQSTMNLSSMANESGGLTVRRSGSRSHSPSRLMSPGRMSTHNGDRDWDNGSTISSSTSIPEYTGPKLYKEPSFKSNKFIIHNAISRCCLAGKVNEPQKNKIVEEMEKSTANHFLILFRDASCQFRAVYTMNPETEEMTRLTGIGPRLITLDMVESIYKYSSDRKQFTAIPSKTMSMSVDAVTIPGHFWQKRPGTPKKLGTPK